MKKIILITLLIVLPQSVFASFNDVHWSHLHKKAIDNLLSTNIVRGYTDGTFKPEKNISRAEMLKILVEAQFLNKDTTQLNSFASQNCFQDSAPQDWFNKYLCWAKNEGWVNGFDNGQNFKPGKSVTLVEALKLALVSSDLEYPQTDRWYRGVVDVSSQFNLIPIDIEYFHNNITRAQMADMITRHIHHKSNTLDTYLGDIKNTRVSFDTLKVRENLYNSLNTDCKSPSHYRMISQTTFWFDNPSKDCLHLVKYYTNSLDELPQNTGLKKHEDKSYYTVFYKTTLSNPAEIQGLLDNVTHYEDVATSNYDLLSQQSQYSSMSGVFFTNFPGKFAGFRGIEFPVIYSDNAKLPFEQQEQMWTLEAEDRFETVSECRAYNFPSFMMFKIKTFYEYCKKLGM
jgi:hypothetical protein